MAKLWYTKSTRYIQPAWTMESEFIDGLYVNSALFEDNILVRNGVFYVTAKPSKHLRKRRLLVTMLAYEGGKVTPKTREMNWSWLEDHPISVSIVFTNNFYGIGLNLIYLSSAVDMVTSAPVEYAVDYLLEVTY